MNNMQKVHALIGPTDPLLRHKMDNSTSGSLAALERIVETARSGPVPDKQFASLKTKRRTLAVISMAACISVGLTVLVSGLGNNTAQAATPPVLRYDLYTSDSGKAVLEKISDHLAALPEESVAASFRYVRTENWALDTAVSPRRSVSTLVSQQTETWRRPDGTGILRTAAGSSLSGRIDATLNTVKLENSRDQVLAANAVDGIAIEKLANVANLRFDSVRSFAKTVDANANVDNANGALAVESIHELFSQQPLPPRVRGQVWRMLSTVPGVTAHGETSDRAGRRGVALTIDDDGSTHGLPVRHLLVVDPSTGFLLEYDTILTKDPGKLNIEIPAVLDLTVFLGAGYTNSTTQRPPS